MRWTRALFASLSSIVLLTGAMCGPVEAAGDAGVWRRLAQPKARWFHAAAFDPAAQRMVVFGGESGLGDLSDVWQLSVAPNWRWTRMSPTGAAPSPRFGFSHVYDSARGRVLVFGGLAGATHLNDVWALTLSNPPVWAPIVTSGGPPAGRRFAAAIYDPVRDRLVVTGGRDGTGHRSDVWVLSLASRVWTQVFPGGGSPTARSAQGAAYDPVRDRLVMFGGQTAAGDVNELWALSLGASPAWSALPSVGTPPVPGRFRSATYIPAGDRLVIFGGLGPGYTNEAWTFGLGSGLWTPLAPAAPLPVARAGHSALLDPVHGELLVFGGGNDALPEFYGDVWSLSLGASPAWSKPIPDGPPPPRREGHSAILDPIRERLIVFGGSGESGLLNDVWELPLTGEPVWRPFVAFGNPPSPRSGHTAVYDAARDRMVIFGGVDEFGYSNETFELPLSGTPVWGQIGAGPTMPDARADHGAAYDPVGSRMIITGGRNATGYYSDSWQLSLGLTPVWSSIPATTPACLTPFAFQSFVRDPIRDQYIAYGGDNYGLPACQQTWGLRAGVSPSWTTIAASGPAWRYDHTAVYEASYDRMLVFGGGHASLGLGDPVRQFGDLWELAPGVPAWTVLHPVPALLADGGPDSLQGHIAVVDPTRHRMLVFGGRRGIGSPTLLDETWALDYVPGLLGVSPSPPTDRSGLRLAIGPNPARSGTEVAFVLPSAERVTIAVHDIAGRLVRTIAKDERLAEGLHHVRWDGTLGSGERAPSGLYLIRVRAGGVTESRRVVLIDG